MRLNTLRAFTAALVVTVSLPNPAVAKSREGGRQSTTAQVAAIGITNFGRVDGAYYRGGQPEARDYPALASLGVKTVINLTSDDADSSEQSLTEHAGMRYVQIPMTTHRPPTPAQLAEFMRIVGDPASQPVYVHCVGGRHRTGVMTAVYRMTHDGWSADQAFSEMQRYKFGASFLHPEFKKFVYAYPAVLGGAAPAAATKAGS